MTCAAEVGVTEAYNAAVSVLVAGAVVIDTWLIDPVNVVRYCVRVWTQLHKAVREAGSREGVSHAVGANKDIYLDRRMLCYAANRQAKHQRY